MKANRDVQKHWQLPKVSMSLVWCRGQAVGEVAAQKREATAQGDAIEQMTVFDEE